MKGHYSCAALALVIGAWPAGARAALSLSTKPTADVVCNAGVCTATAKNANLNVADLAAMLAGGNASVVAGSQAQDITVAAPFGWTSASSLSLDAYRSVTVKRPVSVRGSGAFSLLTNDGGTKGDLFFEGKGSLRFWDLSSNLSINAKTFVLVDRIGALAKAIHKAPSGNYAWARSYNAAHLGTLTKTPVAKTFTGTFEGLGNTISNLAIADDGSDGGDVGLFAVIGMGGTVRDVNFENLQVSAPASTAYLGGLAGENNGGAIIGVNAAVTVSATYFAQSVGGLVGNIDAGTVLRSSTSGSVSGAVQFGSPTTGGLAGANGDGGQVLQSNSSAAVTGIADSGGLVGANGSYAESKNPLISDSSASGPVSSNGAGGLVGLNSHASIVNSHASGNVKPPSGSEYGADAGGLADTNNGGTITNCHATGTVTTNDGQPSASTGGGLVGVNQNDGTYVASISQSWATGNAKGGRYAWIGGIAGMLEGGGEISNTYATGSVTGDTDAYVGGIVGYYFHGSVALSYATGVISTGQYVGGVIGEDAASPGGLSDLYWDTQTSGQNFGIGHSDSGNTSGTQGLTTAQLQSGLPAGFAPSVWSESGGVNGGFPYLLAVPPPGGGGPRATALRR
jgi:hypothetical protein